MKHNRNIPCCNTMNDQHHKTAHKLKKPQFNSIRAQCSIVVFVFFVASLIAIFLYKKCFEGFNLIYFLCMTLIIVCLLVLVFQGIKHLLHQRRISLLFCQLYQQCHQKGPLVMVGFVVIFIVIMHLSSCTHAPKSSPNTMIEVKPGLIAQQTKINQATNYIYAPKGMYQHQDNQISGVIPESPTTSTP